MVCVEHKQAGFRGGYAKTTRAGRSLMMHRVVYCEYNGISVDSIGGLIVRHTCDNPRCINPVHLVVGTQQDNMDDKVARGRAVRGSAHAVSKLTEEQVAAIRSEYVPRKVSQRTLARKYNVTQALIWYVLNKGWTHTP